MNPLDSVLSNMKKVIDVQTSQINKSLGSLNSDQLKEVRDRASKMEVPKGCEDVVKGLMNKLNI